METQNPQTSLVDDSEFRAQMLEKSFSPSAPIRDSDLFAGRREQRRDIALAVNQPGQHVIVFGERGVGKTSLANILEKQYQASKETIAVRINCETQDSFESLWKKALEEMAFVTQKLGTGFVAPSTATSSTLADYIPSPITSNGLRKLFSSMPGKKFVVIFDEFDRLTESASAPFADLIKTFSDQDVQATLILVGVADNIGTLIKEHASIERALMQILMPRMSEQELKEIVTGGLSRAAMTVGTNELDEIANLSQGLPHYTHLLGLLAGREANDQKRSHVLQADVYAAIFKGVDKAQESIKTSHYEAVLSARKDNLFTQVLLACALAKLDSKGTFAAADVREPLSRIMGEPYDITAFSQHLNDFSIAKRGEILQKLGPPRKIRFRFRNPLMQPYVIMHGLKNGLLKTFEVLPTVQ